MPEDVDLYVVSTSPDPNRQNYPPSEWLADWPGPVLVDDESRQVASTFGLTAFPYMVFVYADGTVAARYTGALPYDTFLEAVDFLAENAASG
jgi:hypothetical protein